MTNHLTTRITTSDGECFSSSSNNDIIIFSDTGNIHIGASNVDSSHISINQENTKINATLLVASNIIPDNNNCYIGGSNAFFKEACVSQVRLSENHVITYDEAEGKIKVGTEGDLQIIGESAVYSSNIIPTVYNAYDLGSEVERWRNLYLGGNLYLDGTVVDTDSWNYLMDYIIPTQSTVTPKKLMGGSSQYHSGYISDGAVYMFGLNDKGQLGLDDTVSRYVPTHVKSITTPAVSMAVGSDFTIVVLQDGTAVAFGNNTYGQLGDGTTVRRYYPEAVSLPESKIIASVSAGYNYAMYLMTDGTAYGVGEGTSGQIGNGQLTTNNLTAQQFIVPGDGISLGSPIARISCGSYHTVAVLQNGVALVSGSNSMGQLGTNPATITTTSTPTPLANFGPVVSAACGHDFTILIKDDGTVGSMGNNSDGQLGRTTGATYEINEIVAVASEVNSGLQAGNGLLMKVDAGLKHAVLINHTGKWTKH